MEPFLFFLVAFASLYLSSMTKAPTTTSLVTTNQCMSATRVAANTSSVSVRLAGGVVQRTLNHFLSVSQHKPEGLLWSSRCVDRHFYDLLDDEDH
jgi:hypothetical protein